jgi:hypothetical protein
MNTTYATFRKYEKCTPNVGRKYGEKIPLGRLGDICEDNINIDLKV